MNQTATTTKSDLRSDPDLLPVAQRLFWWEKPEEALTNRHRFAAQVMSLGTWEDIMTVKSKLGEAIFEEVINAPPPGVFSARRWNYWHVRLGRFPVPPLPHRFPA